MQSHDRRGGVLGVMRAAGGLTLLAVGAVHLQRYLDGYQSIPTIGPLFLLNAIGAGIVGLLLLVPFDRKLAPWRANVSVGLLALAGVALATGALIALAISEGSSLFGFSEQGYGAPIIAAIVSEAATVLLLGPVAVVRLARAVAPDRSAKPRSAWAGRSTPSRTQAG